MKETGPTDFTAPDPDFAQRVEASFAAQGMMGHMGARLRLIEPGVCEIELPYADGVSQQHGFFHGGAIGTIADTAGGYAAFSLMEASDGVLTVEYKLNLMAPAQGELLIARGRVVATWSHSRRRGRLVVEVRPLSRWSPTKHAVGVRQEADAVAAHLELGGADVSVAK